MFGLSVIINVLELSSSTCHMLELSSSIPSCLMLVYLGFV